MKMTRVLGRVLLLMTFPSFASVRLCRTRLGLHRLEWALLRLCLCLFSCLLFGQTPSAPASQQFTVTGTVVNEATGEPISRALVTMHGSPTRNVFSDSNGSFSIEAVDAGQHTITAQKPGYFGRNQTRGTSQWVEVGPNSDSLVIRLDPENVVFGRLTDSNGQPVEAVSVRLTQRVVRNGKAHWEQRGWAQSDDDGSYRFPNLQPGTYYVSAGPEAVYRDALFATPDQPHTGWPGVYFPEAPDLPSAAAIRVHSGQHFQADIIMNRAPLFVVSGVVSGKAPGQGFSLQVQNSSGEPVSVGTQLQHDSGRFEIHLPSGTYRLKATSDTGEQQLRAEARLTVEHDLNQVQLVLQPAVSIPIEVRMDDRGQNQAQGAPAGVGGSRAGLPSGNAPPVSVHLIAAEPGGADVFSSYSGTGGNRTFGLRGIDPGRYTAEVSSYGGWYVESAQCGNTNLLTEDLIVGAGMSCSMDIALRNDSGTLSVTVQSPQQAASSAGSGIVLLVPARMRAAVRTLAHPYGALSKTGSLEFRVNDLAPGDYLLYAFDSQESVEYSNAEALRPYASQAVPVTIIAGQTVKATAQVIPIGGAPE